jgi:hypothetical protein
MYMFNEEGKKKYMCNSMEGERFALGCRCGEWHVRFATLHSISHE